MPQALLPSPIGNIRLYGDGGMLTAIHIGGVEPFRPSAQADPLMHEAMAQLTAFFAGRLTRFDLPLAPPATPRGAAHREAIVAVDYGTTASYGALAHRIGSSPRAAGQACRRNPFPIMVPCHRISGAGSAPGHYSAGDGLPTKNWLLNHERKGR